MCHGTSLSFWNDEHARAASLLCHSSSDHSSEASAGAGRLSIMERLAFWMDSRKVGLGALAVACGAAAAAVAAGFVLFRRAAAISAASPPPAEAAGLLLPMRGAEASSSSRSLVSETRFVVLDFARSSLSIEAVWAPRS